MPDDTRSTLAAIRRTALVFPARADRPRLDQRHRRRRDARAVGVAAAQGKLQLGDVEVLFEVQRECRSCRRRRPIEDKATPEQMSAAMAKYAEEVDAEKKRSDGALMGRRAGDYVEVSGPLPCTARSEVRHAASSHQERAKRITVIPR
jgi:hypothetical protein